MCVCVCVPYLGPIKGHPSKDGLRDACSLQFLSHTVVDVARHVRGAHTGSGRGLVLRPGSGAHPQAPTQHRLLLLRLLKLLLLRLRLRLRLLLLRLLGGLSVGGLGEDLGGSPAHRRVVEVLLRGGGQALAGQHAAHSVLLVEELGHHQLLVDHLGAERLGHQRVGPAAQRGASADVGHFPAWEEKRGALIGRATRDWLLGEGDMCGLLGEAVDLWRGKRKDKCTIT